MNLRYLQECEIKHGRVAMLAAVGFLFTQYIRLPGEAYSAVDPFKAIDQAGLGVDLQVLFGTFVF